MRILFEAISGLSFQVGYSKKPTRKSIALRHWILALRQIEKTCSFDSCGDEVETRISEKPTCFDPRHFRLRAQAANPPLHPQLYQTVTEACFYGSDATQVLGKSRLTRNYTRFHSATRLNI